MKRLGALSVVVVVLVACSDSEPPTTSGRTDANGCPVGGCGEGRICVVSCGASEAVCVDNPGRCSSCLCFERQFGAPGNPCNFGTRYSASCSGFSGSEKDVRVFCGCA